jgi:hypothetical protein
MKLILPILADTGDVTALMVASMALDIGGTKKSPRARAAAGAVALEDIALTIRSTAPVPN